MGTPDIRGTPGTFSFYTDRVIPNKNSFSGGVALGPLRDQDAGQHRECHREEQTGRG